MCRVKWLSYFLVMLLCLLLFIPSTGLSFPQQQDLKGKNQDASVIIEVEGNANKRKQYLQTYFPYIKVIAVYDKLFNGLAIKTKLDKLAKIASLKFVKAVHPNHTYQTNATHSFNDKKTMDRFNNRNALQTMRENKNNVFPETLNQTSYTGRGIKVGVIDTGIDYHHPDLQKNYQGGYDLVDLDDDPMETQPDEGEPTLHGTHVAGIIAADGKVKGVAPDASIYAYRALGPGGSGTSAQVIAALEQAVKDGMDIVNLSLGNTVNGPDYPTSMAVNKANKLGVFVVTANGNDGPDDWTVGSPATAKQSFSVGAFANAQYSPALVMKKNHTNINIHTMLGSVPWKLQRDHAITTNMSHASGKIVLVQRGKTPFYELAKQAENKGAKAVLIYNNQSGEFQGSIENNKQPLQIPVASLLEKDGKTLANYSKESFPYVETDLQQTQPGVATFSSRGPVTVDWQIKPNILAPGTNIVSTVPEGYAVLQGTSMAAPHVAGVVALIKEAHPNWSNQKVAAALETTAKPLQTESGPLIAPTIQGKGEIAPNAAIHTNTIIYNGRLVFGKTGKNIVRDTTTMTIENTSNQSKTYHFENPNVQKGLSWHLPLQITVAPKERKKLKIQANILPALLDKGLHQGWLNLSDGEQMYQLPYLFINQEANSPKAGGFEFSLKPFSKDEYIYRFYLSEHAENVQAILYQTDTLFYKQKLFTLDDVEQGMNEGKINKKLVPESGDYSLLFIIQGDDGAYETQEIPVSIEKGTTASINRKRK